MKRSGADAQRYLARPDPAAAGFLIYGPDAMRASIKRQEALRALLGDTAEEEMRLARIAAADLRRDPAALLDAIKAQGFFPGPRAAFVEDAGDSVSETISTALEQWRPGDAQIVVTAGTLPAKSRLRKLFEDHRNASAIAIYADPPGPAEIEAELARAGLAAMSPEARADLAALALVLDPADFRQTIEKLALYKLDDPTSATPSELAACTPLLREAAFDELVEAAGDGGEARIGPLIRRLGGQGTDAVQICIAILRHFKDLHALASAPGGPQAGLGRMRPPLWGKRREMVLRHARDWGGDRLERAIPQIVETDLVLRSSNRAPELALVERLLIRLCRLRTGTSTG